RVESKEGGKCANETLKVNPQSPDKTGGRKSEKEEVDSKEKQDNKEGAGILKDAEAAKPEKDTGKAVHSADTADVQKKEIPETQSVRPASTKSSEVKHIVKNVPQREDARKKPNPAAPREKDSEEESDLESSDEEEKEYFDDSTEERFHKQSSQSEESDDDFFVGKVSKFKKKKQKSEGHEVKGDSTDKVKTSDKVQSELNELESRLKSKGSSLQSVFCSSLSGSKQGGGGGAGRGRGGDKSRGQRKPRAGSGFNKDLSKQPKFQKQDTGAERNSESKYSKPRPEGRRLESEERGFAFANRGRGRGRGDVTRQKTHMGRGAFSHQAPQQALHPSWEASKKRKEQQGQILAFQGKKIKFDDDD
uniref:Serum response factor-binding protein 1 n=1 Tax=Lates calcarifer TaxID=8187 RepID=A0A4W6FIE1_LATCA